MYCNKFDLLQELRGPSDDNVGGDWGRFVMKKLLQITTTAQEKLVHRAVLDFEVIHFQLNCRVFFLWNNSKLFRLIGVVRSVLFQTRTPFLKVTLSIKIDLTGEAAGLPVLPKRTQQHQLFGMCTCFLMMRELIIIVAIYSIELLNYMVYSRSWSTVPARLKFLCHIRLVMMCHIAICDRGISV